MSQESFRVNWVTGGKGCSGGVHFVDDYTVAYALGNFVKFKSVFSGKESIAAGVEDARGVGAMAAHPSGGVFAYSNVAPAPTIHVLEYPSCEKVASLKGGAKLEFYKLAFSYSHHLASLSTQPDCTLTIWQFKEGVKLCLIDLGLKPGANHGSPSLSFSPLNWRDICVTFESGIHLFTVEQSNKKYLLPEDKIAPLAIDGGDPVGDRAKSFRQQMAASRVKTASSVDSAITVSTDGSESTPNGVLCMRKFELPDHSVAGLTGNLAERFEFRDALPLCRPTNHVWTGNGQMLIGCQTGHLIRITKEPSSSKMIFVPNAIRRFLEEKRRRETRLEVPRSKRRDPSAARMTRAVSGSSAASSGVMASHDEKSAIAEGSFRCMTLHSAGLYVGGDDGYLRLLQIEEDDLTIVENISFDDPLQSLSLSKDFHNLVVGTSRGSVSLYNLKDQATKTLVEIPEGLYVGMGLLANGTHLVVARETGEVQVLEALTGSLIASAQLDAVVAALVCSPSLPIAAAASEDGVLLVLDISNVESPRVVRRIKLHVGGFKVAFDDRGVVIVTGGADGSVYVLGGAPSSGFDVLAWTAEVTDAFEYLVARFNPDNQRIKVAGMLNTDPSLGKKCRRIFTMEFPSSLARDPTPFLQSSARDFKEKVINKMILDLQLPTDGLVLLNASTAFTSVDGRLIRFRLPMTAPVRTSKQGRFVISLDEKFAGHAAKAASRVATSLDVNWIFTYGDDGCVTLRASDKLGRGVVSFLFPHDFRELEGESARGVVSLAVSRDVHYIYTCGADGAIAAFKRKSRGNRVSQPPIRVDPNEVEALKALPERHPDFSDSGFDATATDASLESLDSNTAATTVTDVGDVTISENTTALVATTTDDGGDDSLPVSPELDPSKTTWILFQKASVVRQEDKEYSTLKKELRKEIREIRRRLEIHMEQNQQMGTLERLGREEFELDMDEKLRLETEAARRIRDIRADIEYNNLAKAFKREIIKAECWDAMTVKGRTIKAFKSSLEVHNFAMRALLPEELGELQMAQWARRVEMGEEQVRCALVVEDKNEVAEEDEEAENETAEESQPQPSTTGSCGVEFGGDSEFFYSQFRLNARARKINQIVLLKDAIRRIRECFNEEFDSVFLVKEQQIQKINEKNRRVRRILEDLGDPGRPVYEPKLSSEEKPETLLEVTDDEVSGEKYISDEQRAQMEEQALIEEKRRRSEKGDNVRERALDQMMGGVLEVKKEDELRKDIPVPLFMHGSLAKPEEEWTEEEIRAAKEYERKCKELAEEREKYRKQLETELKKIEGSVAESVRQFDELLTRLFLRKVKTETVICQEELKILRMQRQLTKEDEFDAREAELMLMKEELKAKKLLATAKATEARRAVEAFRDQYDILVAEDKVMDKSFRREFADIPSSLVDQLNKLFRRRPRGKGIGFGAGSPEFEEETLRSSEANPYKRRPTTAETNLRCRQALEVALKEMDEAQYAPEACVPDVWARLCQVRRSKIMSEQQMKAKAMTLADMTAFATRRYEEDEAIKNEIEDISAGITRVAEHKANFLQNLQVQLIVKQGQVELNLLVPIYDFSGAILVHRGVVEDLNSAIRQLGQQKIESMLESQEFRKGIVQLEWARRKAQMKMDDLHSMARDIQMLKVTRDIQAFLASENYESKKVQEVTMMENTMVMQDKRHRKNFKEKQKRLMEMQGQIETRTRENDSLIRNLDRLNVVVSERRHVVEERSVRKEGRVSGAELRMKDIVHRRRLVEMAKAQAQEVALLRAEVERLRMRTFPALVQVQQ